MMMPFAGRVHALSSHAHGRQKERHKDESLSRAGGHWGVKWEPLTQVGKGSFFSSLLDAPLVLRTLEPGRNHVSLPCLPLCKEACVHLGGIK